MAEKKEEPKVDNEVGSLKVKEQIEKQPVGNETKGNVTKVKAKMKKPAEDQSKPTVTKVDLSKPKTEEDAVSKQSTDEVPVQNEPATSEKVVEEIIETTDEKSSGEGNAVQNETTPPVKEVEKVIEKSKPLPEGVEKLVNFIEETGGDLNDYVKLNQDYSDLDNVSLLKEYYKQTKPHLNNEEIDFLMEDQFSFNEDNDDEKEVKRKKLALKEQVASAKTHLEESKSKYYEDIKAGSKLTEEQQKAIDFFNRYNEEQVENEKGAEHRTSIFHEKTKNVFNDDFKGFEFKVGDKKFRYNVQDASKVKENQSDISNFVGKFLNKNNEMSDAEGYHKSLYTAMNPDAIAKHFYEQGQADALKQSVEKGKNISMDPRQQHGTVEAGGMKVKVLGDNSASFKFKIKNKN
jgi:hypothetical protein